MASCTWTGDASSDWGDAQNWAEGQVPESDDDVIIPTETPTCMPAACQIKSLTMTGGALNYGGPVSVVTGMQYSGGLMRTPIDLLAGSDSTIQLSNLGEDKMCLSAQITVEGSLAVNGTSDFALSEGGGFAVSSGGVLLIGDAVRLWQVDGAPAVITSGGSVKFAASAGEIELNGVVEFTGGEVSFDGDVRLPGGCKLRFHGATISGSGNLIVDGGTLTCGTTTALNSVSLQLMNGGTLDCDGDGMGAVKLEIARALTLSSGALVDGRIHLTGQATLDAIMPSGDVRGVLVLEGQHTIDEAFQLHISGTGEVIVAGTLEVSDGAVVAGGLLTVVGVMDLKPGQATLDSRTTVTSTDVVRAAAAYPWGFDTSTVRRGRVVIREGSSVTTTDGMQRLVLEDGFLQIDAADSAATFPGDFTVGINANGALRTAGALPSELDVAGRLDLLGATASCSNLTMEDSGRISAAAFDGHSPALHVTGAAFLAGTVEIGWAADAEPPGGDFLRADSRLVDYFQRTDLPGGFRSQWATTDNVASVQISAFVGVPGLDTKVWPDAGTGKVSPPLGASSPYKNRQGEWLMQQLFECTDFAYVGFYLHTHDGHPDTSWEKRRALLRKQGWGVAVFMLPTNSSDKSQTPFSAALSAADADADVALERAKKAGLDAQSVVYYDIEPDLVNKYHINNLLPYVKRWVDKVNAGNYRGGVYGNVDFLAAFQTDSSYADTPVMLTNDPTPGADPFGPDRRVQFVPLSSCNPKVSSPSGWQWKLDVPGKWMFPDLDGVMLSPCPGRGWDFSTSQSIDPSAGGADSTKPYNAVSAIQQDSTQLTTEQAVTIQLKNEAPPPCGTVVYLASDQPITGVPSQVVVPAGDSSIKVSLDSSGTDNGAAANLFAWTAHQTLARAVTVEITAPQ